MCCLPVVGITLRYCRLTCQHCVPLFQTLFLYFNILWCRDTSPFHSLRVLLSPLLFFIFEMNLVGFASPFSATPTITSAELSRKNYLS